MKKDKSQLIEECEVSTRIHTGGKNIRNLIPALGEKFDEKGRLEDFKTDFWMNPYHVYSVCSYSKEGRSKLKSIIEDLGTKRDAIDKEIQVLIEARADAMDRLKQARAAMTQVNKKYRKSDDFKKLQKGYQQKRNAKIKAKTSENE